MRKIEPKLKFVDYINDPDHDDADWMPHCGICSESTEILFYFKIHDDFDLHMCSACKDKITNVLNSKPEIDLRYIDRYALNS